jgi:hypothetical protein
VDGGGSEILCARSHGDKGSASVSVISDGDLALLQLGETEEYSTWRSSMRRE